MYGESRLDKKTRKRVIEVIRNIVGDGGRIYSEYARIKVTCHSPDIHDYAESIDAQLKKMYFVGDKYLYYKIRNNEKQCRHHTGITFYFKEFL